MLLLLFQECPPVMDNVLLLLFQECIFVVDNVVVVVVGGSRASNCYVLGCYCHCCFRSVHTLWTMLLLLSLFQECLSVMDESELIMWHESCIIDVCSSEDDITLGICANAEALAARCTEDLKVELGNWRGPDFCCKFSRFISLLNVLSLSLFLSLSLSLSLSLCVCVYFSIHIYFGTGSEHQHLNIL